jgi:uncharacterized coiled-coil protein SlyX
LLRLIAVLDSPLRDIQPASELRPMTDISPKKRQVSEPRGGFSPSVLLILFLAVGVIGAGAVVSSIRWSAHDLVVPSDALDKANEAIAGLRQMIQDLQTAQQRTAVHIGELQRQLSAEQTERKSLTDQVNALTERVKAADTPAPPSPQATKRKR